MQLSEVHARGFRCFGEDAPLTLDLRKGLNILVGSNDAGKSAIIDAIRLTLGTRSEEWFHIAETDFHTSASGTVGSLFIRCTLDNLTPDEETRFLEWCTLENGRLRLHVCLQGSFEKLSSGGRRPTWERRTGPKGEGLAVDGALREYLAATYIRPLRDAERELNPGRRSRLSQILANLPEMSDQQAMGTDADGQPTLAGILAEADRQIQKNPLIRNVQERVNDTYLSALTVGHEPLVARLGIGNNISLNQILERLTLALGAPNDLLIGLKRGLGLNNMLFMAAELLLLQSGQDQLPLLLIEEPEAHLHPQLQARFMQMLDKQNETQQQIQVILTTHSPLLAAGADLNAMVLMVRGQAYSLSEDKTQLKASDYAFLRRFLEATKSNLFFAQGVLIVEGDAENLLLPAIAKALGRPLPNHGVSIVKVGHTGFFRYSRILQRKDDNEVLPIPVACLTDLDIPPDEARVLDGHKQKQRRTEANFPPNEKAERRRKLKEHEGGTVRVFPSSQWTLEFDLAMDGLALEMHQAILLAKDDGKNSRSKVMQRAEEDIRNWKASGKNSTQIAIEIYRPLHDRTVSKAEAAEQLARIIHELDDTPETFRKRLTKHLSDAIDYVTNPALTRQSKTDETQEAIAI